MKVPDLARRWAGLSVFRGLQILCGVGGRQRKLRSSLARRFKSSYSLCSSSITFAPNSRGPQVLDAAVPCSKEGHGRSQGHAQPREDIAALGVEGLVPEVTEVTRQDHRPMAGDLFFESLKFFAALRGVKESSAARWRVASSRHILFAVRRSRWLLVIVGDAWSLPNTRLATPSPVPRPACAGSRATLSPKGERDRDISAQIYNTQNCRCTVTPSPSLSF